MRKVGAVLVGYHALSGRGLAYAAAHSADTPPGRGPATHAIPGALLSPDLGRAVQQMGNETHRLTANPTPLPKRRASLARRYFGSSMSEYETSYAYVTE